MSTKQLCCKFLDYWIRIRYCQYGYGSGSSQSDACRSVALLLSSSFPSLTGTKPAISGNFSFPILSSFLLALFYSVKLSNSLMGSLSYSNLKGEGGGLTHPPGDLIYKDGFSHGITFSSYLKGRRSNRLSRPPDDLIYRAGQSHGIPLFSYL
jgi:hypothetical protein